ncbi:MAG: triose-phosphate isomerase family protein, partial [Candidatus Puniceispirillales bacterium]
MTIIASNWKMNLDRQSAEQLLVEMASCPVGDKVKRIVFPSFTLLDLARATREQIGLANHLALGGQDCHAAANGAHTGDVSAAMLIESGCQWVLVGHSERRQNHKESSATIAAKLEMAQAEGLSVMLCIGENLAERESGHAEA